MSKENIINTYDQNAAAGGDRIVIWRRLQERGRGYRSASWQVGRVLNGKIIPTDPTPRLPGTNMATKVLASLPCITTCAFLYTLSGRHGLRRLLLGRT